MNKSKLRIRASDARHTPKKGIHQHQHYEILIIQEGNGSHIVDFEHYQVKAKQVYFLRPGQSHEFLPDRNAKFFFIAFDQDDIIRPIGFKQFDFFQSFYCSGPVQLDEIDSIIKHLRDIDEELQNPGPMQELLLSGLVSVLLIKIQRKFSKFAHKNPEIKQELIQQFNQMIDDPNCNYRFVKEYAKELHVNQSYLNDIIKKTTGKTASYWIQKKQLNLSKLLLIKESENLKTIANNLGFKNATHFSRFFKQHSGQSPSAYIKNFH